MTSEGPPARDWSTGKLLASLYDWEHDEFQADVDLYVALAKRTGGPVLELACGTGRVLNGLARANFDVVGLDRSSDMLGRAMQRLHDVRSRVGLVQGDMEADLPVGEYGLVVLALDALGLIEETMHQTVLLRKIGEALRPGGLAVFDITHAARVAEQPSSIPILQRMGASEELGAEVATWVVREAHPASQIEELHCFYDLTWEDRTVTRVQETLRLRTFAPFELRLLLAGAGLEEDAFLGDYDGGSFVDESDRMILIARKSALQEDDSKRDA